MRRARETPLHRAEAAGAVFIVLPLQLSQRRPLLAVFLRSFGWLGRRRACRFGFTRSRNRGGSRDFADLVGLDPLLGGCVPSKALQLEVVFVVHRCPAVLLPQLALPCFPLC